MLKFKRTLSIIIILSLTLTLFGCGSSKKDSKDTSANTKTEKQTLNIGLMPSVDAVPFIIAKDKGFYEKNGVDVKLQVFKSANDRDAALQTGNLDGVSTDEVAVCLYQNAGIDLKITGVTDGDFMLVASKQSGIKSIADVKGKSVAISQKTVIEYSLDKMLEKNSIKPEEVKKIAIPAIPARLEMLKAGKVDLALLPEPFSSAAIKDGAVLLGKTSSEKLLPAVSAFTQKSIDNKSDAIKAFYKAYNEAVEYVNNTPISQYEDTVIKFVGYPEDMKGNIVLPKFRADVLPSDNDLNSAVKWTKDKGIVKKSLTPKDLTYKIK
ncbi:MetQ/NlpA family ABC transporter substrate-binding protein [Clostridium sp. JN-9]|uniref:ABC transporter substrate-binding protein n=1 Tax=Clostridium sp. JN-9 TaxID=2507159 RepID=UPI000FFE1C4E|nr:MetQ/NlpA family ABC transporter substrate-binding protein [Clostridium sp. JN-9]QAT39121.1 transporter substrate-binding domain-containing protein [Clostridium sp. JN-9]